jgi:prepilin-type N-terminal cleavage/methylation domain-containing protein
MSAVPTRAAGSSGFTLVEVMVALMIGTMTVTLAFQLFRGIDDAIRALRARDVIHTREVNARRWLAFAFAGVDVTPTTGAPVESSADGIHFVGWTQAPDGWAEANQIDVQLTDGDLVGRIAGRSPVRLVAGVDTMVVDFLDRRGADATWLSSWASTIIAPVAVRFRLVVGDTIDTLLLSVGGGA